MRRLLSTTTDTRGNNGKIYNKDNTLSLKLMTDFFFFNPELTLLFIMQLLPISNALQVLFDGSYGGVKW